MQSHKPGNRIDLASSIHPHLFGKVAFYRVYWILESAVRVTQHQLAACNATGERKLESSLETRQGSRAPAVNRNWTLPNSSGSTQETLPSPAGADRGC